MRLHPEDGDTRVGAERHRLAYDVMAPNVIGPGWLERRRFDITATPPPGYKRTQLAAARGWLTRPQLNAGVPAEQDVSLFTALREALGLRLDSIATSVETWW